MPLSAAAVMRSPGGDIAVNPAEISVVSSPARSGAFGFLQYSHG
jgi:hypothetical protein